MWPGRRRFALCAALLIAAIASRDLAAHDIPNDVVVRLFVRAEGDRLRVLARAPLAALRDVQFPLRADGTLDIARADSAVRSGVVLWIASPLAIYEDDRRLAPPSLTAAVVSLPADRSFDSYDAALAHVSGARLPDDTTLIWNQALVDVLLEYSIRSDRATFSIDPGLERLGVRVVTVIRFLPVGRAERVFELSGDPGLVRLDPRWHQAASQFVRLGFRHILDGKDHLLFLFCLVIPFRRLKPLIVIVTAFTVAHSITLIAATMDMAPKGLWFPPLIETLIAVSIFYMAIENVVGGARLERRWIAAFAFGLIHGFGFSFALGRTLQLAGSHLVTSLLSFNVGVELGQIAVLLLLVPLLDLCFRYAMAERVGTIVLSLIVGHVSWHWMGERWEALRQFDWPRPDAADLARGSRWLMGMVAISALVWFARIATVRFRLKAKATSLTTEPTSSPSRSSAHPSPTSRL